MNEAAPHVVTAQKTAAQKKAVVTGCAGFIGSHLSERLIRDGWQVVGIDAFTSYYPRELKEANLTDLRGSDQFRLVEGDLLNLDLATEFADADAVFHLAAQPGVRASFGSGFDDYVTANVLATQRVLEAALSTGRRRVVMASSSSVYGDAPVYPVIEGVTALRPRSPYGVTKRACEDLADVYRNLGLEVVALRYFTVYGPRQRPDMAFRRLCEMACGGLRFELYGDGGQSRDFTHVSDIVDATFRAAVSAGAPPAVNIGGGHEATMSEVISMVEELSGRALSVSRFEMQRGDVRRTSADTTIARTVLGWEPKIGLREGLASELAWVQNRSLVTSAACVAATQAA
jgi:UDP-glucuronate 4-epimerase